MKASDNNPNTNAVPAGISDDQLTEAVRQSGYPLQTIVASELKEQFGIQEEWSYIDRDSGDLRALDIYARRSLYRIEGPQPRVRPHIVMLIECKRSDLPFIFFKTAGNVWLKEFPLVAGLKEPHVRLTSETDPSMWYLPVITCLNLQQHRFVSSPPALCTTYSKVVRGGKDLQLSGSEAYGSVVLPLVKAMQYFAKTASPLATHRYFDCYATVGICVLDAPMVVAESPSDVPQLTLMPWVRLIRDEAKKDRTGFETSVKYALDFVHRDHLRTYIRDWLLPFSQDFGQRVMKHDLVLAECAGFVPGMWDAGFEHIEANMRPVGVTEKVTRAGLITTRMAKLPRYLLTKVRNGLFAKRRQ